MQKGRSWHRNFKAYQALCSSEHFIMTSIYNGLMQPYFDYCSPLWDVFSTLLSDKLQKFQNRAATITAGASYETRSADVLRSLEWEKLELNKKNSNQSYISV